MATSGVQQRGWHDREHITTAPLTCLPSPAAADYNVTSISFGIELATSGTGTGQPLTVNLYANHRLVVPCRRLAVEPDSDVRADQHSGSRQTQYSMCL